MDTLTYVPTCFSTSNRPLWNYLSCIALSPIVAILFRELPTGVRVK